MIALQLIAAIVAASPQAADASAELTKLLDSYAASYFNGVVYIEKDGREIYFHPVGYADIESRTPFTRSTGIEIGSIVKPVVNVEIVKLAGAGKLSLDDPISKYFENVPEDKKAITIEMLRRHRSGFQDTFGRDYQPMERDQLMKLMLESKLLFEPGSKSEYSNAGYSMLATIIEKVSGEPLEQHIANSQFKPLGIKHFGYVLPKWKPEELTTGYDRSGGRWGRPTDKFWYPDGPGWNLRGNGGMIASAPDLARWCRPRSRASCSSQRARLTS